MLGAADQEVRLDADLPQGADGMLGGLGFELARRLQVRDQGQMDIKAILAADIERELADRFQERQALDIADRPADLGDHDIDVVAGQAVDGRLDLVGHVGNHLNRLALVKSPLAFLLDDRQVDLSRRVVAVAGQGCVRESFVVPEVEVGFRPVVEHVDLAMLVGTHRPGVDVDIGVEFLEPDAQSSLFEQHPDRRAGQSLAQGADHASRHENVLGHREFAHGLFICTARSKRLVYHAGAESRASRSGEERLERPD